MPTVRPRPNPLLLAAELLDPTPHPYQWDPVGWIEATTKDVLWSGQRRVAEALIHHHNVVVPAAHAQGKSHLAGRLAAWWVCTRPRGKVVTTAPSFHQVRGVLWQEIADAHAKGKLPGKLNQTEWWIGGRQMAFGRKPGDTKPGGFQGTHAPDGVLVIVDEADEISEALLEVLDAIATEDHSRVLLLGNPLNPQSGMARRAKLTEDWHLIRLDGLESPNFTGEDVPPHVRRSLLSKEWVERKARDVGENSPIFLARVRAQWPEDRSDGMIPWSWLVQCRGEEHAASLAHITEPVELGVDVGGSENGDLTVIWERRGARLGRRWSIQSPRSEHVAELVVRAVVESGASRAKIDGTGLGWGVCGHVRSMLASVGHSCEVVEVDFGAKAVESSKFRNARSEMYWAFRELVADRAVDLSVLGGDTLEASTHGDRVIAELTTPRYWEGTDGRTALEPKDDLRKPDRLGRSPDDADAIVLAFYNPQPQRTPLWIEGMDEELAALDREQDAARTAPAFGDYWDDEDEDW